jgi:hypothetical protein
MRETEVGQKPHSAQGSSGRFQERLVRYVS